MSNGSHTQAERKSETPLPPHQQTQDPDDGDSWLLRAFAAVVVGLFCLTILGGVAYLCSWAWSWAF